MTATVAAHQPTLEVIRRITDDGMLCPQEVWDLAEHLNGSAEARQAWPGSELFPILVQVFEDDVLSAGELEMLARLLGDVERRCSADAPVPARPGRQVPLAEMTVEEFELPVVRKIVRLETGDGPAEVDLQRHTCTCAEWSGVRREFSGRDLKRCCRHMAEALWNELREGPGERRPQLLRDFVGELSFRGRGVDPDAEWKLLRVEDFTGLVAHGGAEWSSVYARTAEGAFDRYAYHTAERRWAFGQVPAHHQAVEDYFEQVGGAVLSAARSE